MKTCSKCKQNKLATSEFFPLHKKTIDGLSSWCRSCNVAYTKEWKNNNKVREKQNRRNIGLKVYGLTQEQYNLMLNQQNGKCKICNAAEVGSNRCSNFYIDHCHNTGKVRGLLCHSCNFGIGYFKDNIELLNKAINYLEVNNGIS